MRSATARSPSPSTPWPRSGASFRQRRPTWTSPRIGRPLPTTLTAGGTTVTYRYSAEGQRTYKKAGSGTDEYYVLDGTATLGGVTGGSLSHWNVTLPSGEVLGRHLSSGGRRYYRKDHLGSVRAVVSGGGNVMETRDSYTDRRRCS